MAKIPSNETACAAVNGIVTSYFRDSLVTNSDTHSKSRFSLISILDTLQTKILVRERVFSFTSANEQKKVASFSLPLVNKRADCEKKKLSLALTKQKEDRVFL